MKTTKLWLTTIATLLCSLTASAHDFSVGGIYYNISSSTDLTVAVTYRGNYYDSYSNEYTGAVTIPTTVTYNNKTYSVTSIGDGAFFECSSLTSITLPESVTSIGGYAFYNCSSLTSITLPESVTSIGYDAFYNCSSLTAIIIPEGVTSIGYEAFYKCSSLTSITIPASVTSISDYAFSGCSSLTSITIPESVTSIEHRAFSGCSSLTSITLPEGVTSIGDWAFSGCSSLTSITLPEGVTSIGSQAFYNCSHLYKVINYSNLSLSAGSSSNGYVAYYAKKILKGSELTTSGDYQFQTSNGVHYLVNYIGQATDIVLPDDYNGTSYAIGNYAFFDCDRLTSIILPDGVTSIGSQAFYYCSGLISFTVPESVTSIGEYAFSGCSSLTSITIPEGVTSIGNYTFDNCTALKKVIIEDGSSTLSLGYNGSSQGLFYDCPLEEVYLGRNLSYNSGSSYGYSPFYNKGKLTTLTIGDNVTSIGNYAFYNCSSLYSVTIGSGVLSIGNDAFSTPEKVIWLTNTPPTGYTNAKGSINYVANDLYTSLSNVKVYPYLSSMFEVDGVKYVPVSPSERTCHAIDCAYDSTAESINVSETASFKGVAMTVKEVMPYTFYGNKHIKEVDISHKGNIGDYAFYDCDSVQSVEISNEGNVGSQAFYDCDGMLTATISNQGNIESQAFYDCDGIKSLDISNVGYVGDEAFRGCGALETAIVANGPKEIEPTTPEPRPITFANWISTNHSSNSTSSETYTFTAAASATLSFDWWVSSESGYDKLIVTLDGTTIFEKSGSLSGTYNHAITQGEHTLVVKYTKDGSNSSGSDQASVSNIVVSAGSGGTTGLDGAVCNSVFYDCVSLKSVTLGDRVTSLGNDAFRGCTSLHEIVIPNSVKSVGTYCFYGCTVMKNAVIGDGLTNVKEYTFANCSGLESVTMDSGVTAISNYAFSACRSLKDVEVGSNVTTINNYAFQGCSSLPTITLPQAVTKVGDYVFAGCSSLADVVIADRTTPLALGSNDSSPLFVDCPLDSVYIGGKITYSTTSSKGYSPFYRNTSLRTVVITDREEQIYNNEFYGCTNLKNVTIGNGVKSIGNYAFSGCSSLDKFAFGCSMQRIGEEAFSDCTNLTEICSSAMNPPTCGTQALDDINKWNCILKVPTGYMAAYQAADQWKEFFFIEDIVEVATYTLTFMVDGEVYHTVELPYEAAVTMPATPTKEGHTFSGWDKTLSTMPAEDVTISGTFTINKYLVTFKVDGEIVYSESLEYGASIVAPDAPEKEGHTFNGWGEVDTTVPAHDVTYEANYSVNSYQLTYVVDGETVQTESVAYGTAITLIDEPVKEGYTFSGWSEVPETMPAHDVTLNGTFTVNKYLVTFTVDGAVIASDSLEYGTAISVPTMPEREGYTFSGWSEVAETVPAHDVTYDASYTANIYKVYYFVGATLVHTAEVAYGEAIPEYVYEPTAEGDVFVGWVGETYETMPAHDVTYTANIESGINQLLLDNGQLTIYDLMGRKVTDIENLKGGVYIINGRKLVVK